MFKSSIHCECFSVIVGRNLSLQQIVSLVSNIHYHLTISNIAVLCEVVIASFHVWINHLCHFTQPIHTLNTFLALNWSSVVLLCSFHVSLFYSQWITLIKDQAGLNGQYYSLVMYDTLLWRNHITWHIDEVRSGRADSHYCGYNYILVTEIALISCSSPPAFYGTPGFCVHEGGFYEVFKSVVFYLVLNCLRVIAFLVHPFPPPPVASNNFTRGSPRIHLWIKSWYQTLLHCRDLAGTWVCSRMDW